jgi:hypothetical protein
VAPGTARELFTTTYDLLGPAGGAPGAADHRPLQPELAVHATHHSSELQLAAAATPSRRAVPVA